MNVTESIKRVFAAELPEVLVSVENSHIIEVEVPEGVATKSSFAIAKELIDQLADGLMVEFKQINRRVLSATILPILS